MIRFFRTIRHNLMDENKTVKYLKYALGEFILVVLGILVALQINTWNEGRKLQQQRVELIENLKIDFHTNIRRLNESLSKSQDVLENQDKLLKVIYNNGHMSVAELRSMVGQFGRAVTFQPTLGSYRSALSTGEIGLIKDSHLHELFTMFEDANMRFQSNREVSRFDLITGQGYELRRQYGSLEALGDRGLFIPEPLELSDEEYRASLAQKETYAIFENRNEINERLHRALKSLKEVSEQIMTALDAL